MRKQVIGKVEGFVALAYGNAAIENPVCGVGIDFQFTTGKQRLYVFVEDEIVAIGVSGVQAGDREDSLVW
jgi:hypothetical protein